jgi:hypothetical protein
MRRHRQPRPGQGTAWLVVDRSKGDYLCYWYTGTGDAQLVDHARAASADEAVAWGLERTPRVRIRTAEDRTCWVGTAPAPEGFTRARSELVRPNVVSLPPSQARSVTPGTVDEGVDRTPASPSPSRDEQTRSREQRQLVGAGHTPSGGIPC